MAYVIIDGTLIPVDRAAADRPFYSGEPKRHGVNLQVIASPDGTILWMSGELPGSTYDTAAARIDRKYHHGMRTGGGYCSLVLMTWYLVDVARQCL